MPDAAAATHLQNLRSLQTRRGLFLASPQGVGTGYDKAWLRDNFYTSLAFEHAGEWKTVQEVWRAILDVLLKHEAKIDWAAKFKPYASWQYIHARYNPDTFEEYWEEWGNKQNDAIGAILFKLGDLETRKKGVLTTNEDTRIVQRLVDYANSIEYWREWDSGMWEEHEELHASSVGAVVAGLRSVQALPYISIPAGVIEKGEEALHGLLPRESQNKFVDLALLSLFWPYDVIRDERKAKEILGNIEYHLVKKRGLIRYKTDRYYNKNIDGWSEEAEWTMGLPWLSIVFRKRGDTKKADHYLARSREVLTSDGAMPELYFSQSSQTNENVPLGWAESLYAIALMESDTG